LEIFLAKIVKFAKKSVFKGEKVRKKRWWSKRGILRTILQKLER
jgi:hypothetical protein